MATPNTKTTSNAKADTQTDLITEIPLLAEKFREQLVSGVRQTHQLSLGAAQTWVKAVSVLPMSDMATTPAMPAIAGIQALTEYTFGVAADLLRLQHEFALQWTSALVPETTT